MFKTGEKVLCIKKEETAGADALEKGRIYQVVNDDSGNVTLRGFPGWSFYRDWFKSVKKIITIYSDKNDNDITLYDNDGCSLIECGNFTGTLDEAVQAIESDKAECEDLNDLLLNIEIISAAVEKYNLKSRREPKPGEIWVKKANKIPYLVIADGNYYLSLVDVETGIVFEYGDKEYKSVIKNIEFHANSYKDL